jgi:hypothetical protein
MKDLNEIIKKAKYIAKDADNFTYDNYGSEACDNGYYELSYSEDKTEDTLIEFAKWILDLKK